jgi:hypothetical protein
MDMIKELEAPTKEQRLAALRHIVENGDHGFHSFPRTEEVNNHVHTHYSFSPYYPAHAAFQAAAAGLQAVGSVDHDSIGAAREMEEAGALLAIGSTAGYELRVNYTGTAMQGRRLNNPDSENIGYMVVHGVPATAIEKVEQFLRPVNEARNRRNRRQVEGLNEILREYDVPPLEFDRDVVSLSLAPEGGSITERHILYALSLRLIDLFGKGKELLEALRARFRLEVPGRVAEYLGERENPHYAYDLLGVMKSTFLPRFFIQPDEEEAISVVQAVRFANEIGAIPAYAYLGDVGESPTGDKKAQRFEDAFLDELIPELVRIGFKSITYMPPRNTKEQLLRVQRLAGEAGLMEISGVDINSSRQSFNCPEVMDPTFRHLNDTTWALIAHEKLASQEPRYALFSENNPLAELPIKERLSRYAQLGRSMDKKAPRALIDRAGELLKGEKKNA